MNTNVVEQRHSEADLSVRRVVRFKTRCAAGGIQMQAGSAKIRCHAQLCRTHPTCRVPTLHTEPDCFTLDVTRYAD